MCRFMAVRAGSQHATYTFAGWTMYLTRVLLPWRPGQNPYSWHQQLWHLFPEESDRRNRTKDEKKAEGKKAEFPAYFLFYVEEVKVGQGTVLLLQSPAKPVETETVKFLNPPHELTYKAVTGDMKVQFILTANPTKMKSASRNRVPFIGQQNLVSWLQCKIKAFGELDRDILFTPGHPIFFRKGNTAGKINPVRFEGKMRIVDVASFNKAASIGIGPAKAFGCGLLLVKPVK